jgi:hypothetical protein
MSHYIRLVPLRYGSAPQVWKIENGTAVRLGITNPEGGVGSYFKAEDGETIWDALKRLTPWFEPDGQGVTDRRWIANVRKGLSDAA